MALSGATRGAIGPGQRAAGLPLSRQISQPIAALCFFFWSHTLQLEIRGEVDCYDVAHWYGWA
jgi:hypothetical protein